MIGVPLNLLVVLFFGFFIFKYCCLTFFCVCEKRGGGMCLTSKIPETIKNEIII